MWGQFGEAATEVKIDQNRPSFVINERKPEGAQGIKHEERMESVMIKQTSLLLEDSVWSHFPSWIHEIKIKEL